ncbi:MAG: RNA polymerase sigma-70 factor [Bacteroidota bacterium]|nr:RNA polymerase sigma-70 factor [Bacteroidota bacterium]
MNQADNDLFLALKNRDDEMAFEAIFKTYYRYLCLLAMHYLRDSAESEEVVEDVFLLLWEKRKEIVIRSSLRNFLFSSVKNRCINIIEHEKVKNNYRRHQMEAQNEAIIRYSENDFPEIDAFKKIEDCIASLPEKRREIFVLSRQKGLKYKEIANQLNISVKTVETQMGLALKQLRNQLRDLGDSFSTLLFIFLKKL